MNQITINDVPSDVIKAYRAANHSSYASATTTATRTDPDAKRVQQHAFQAVTLGVELFVSLTQSHSLNVEEVTAIMEDAAPSYFAEFETLEPPVGAA